MYERVGQNHWKGIVAGNVCCTLGRCHSHGSGGFGSHVVARGQGVPLLDDGLVPCGGSMFVGLVLTCACAAIMGLDFEAEGSFVFFGFLSSGIIAIEYA